MNIFNPSTKERKALTTYYKTYETTTLKKMWIFCFFGVKDPFKKHVHN